MKENTTTQENTIPTHYTLTPSIGKRKTVNGKTYYVRRFFTGSKDFAEVMQQLAKQQTYRNKR